MSDDIAERLMRLRKNVIACCAITALLAACGHTEATMAVVAPLPMAIAPAPTAPITVDITPDPIVLLAEVPQLSQCAQWTQTALQAGWDAEHLYRLGYILWRESRCQPDALNSTDPNSGSYGLTQINGFWCRPSRYNPDGWLQAQGVLDHCDDLHDPVVNLTAARAIWDYAEDRGCGWSPWATRRTRWC